MTLRIIFCFFTFLHPKVSKGWYRKKKTNGRLLLTGAQIFFCLFIRGFCSDFCPIQHALHTKQAEDEETRTTSYEDHSHSHPPTLPFLSFRRIIVIHALHLTWATTLHRRLLLLLATNNNIWIFAPQHTNLLKSTQNTNMTLQVRRPGSHRQRPISNNWLLTWVTVCPSVCLANAFFLSETGRQDRNYANGSSKKDDWNKFWTLVPQMCRWFCDCRGSLSSSPFTDKRRSSTGVHCQLGPRKLT